MSFEIKINGHSNQPHNAAVQRAVDAALGELRQVEGISGGVTGYTWEAGGEESRVDLARTFTAIAGQESGA